jgi:hypothetical protein
LTTTSPLAAGRPAVFLHALELVPPRTRPRTAPEAALHELRHVPAPPLPLGTASAPPPGAAAWLGPEGILDALVPAARRGGRGGAADLLFSSEDSTTAITTTSGGVSGGADTALLPELRAGRVQLVVDARSSVEQLVAAWGAAPPGTAFVVLLLPPHGLEAHRLLGFCRAARVEAPGRALHCLAVAQPPGGGGLSRSALSAVGALSLRLPFGREPELVVAADGGACWAPRLRPLRLPAAAGQLVQTVVPATAEVSRIDAGDVPNPPAGPEAVAAPPPHTAPAADPDGWSGDGAPTAAGVVDGSRTTWELCITSPGQLSSAGFVETQIPPLREGEVLIEVAGIGLNFR